MHVEQEAGAPRLEAHPLTARERALYDTVDKLLELIERENTVWSDSNGSTARAIRDIKGLLKNIKDSRYVVRRYRNETLRDGVYARAYVFSDACFSKWVRYTGLCDAAFRDRVGVARDETWQERRAEFCELSSTMLRRGYEVYPDVCAFESVENAIIYGAHQEAMRLINVEYDAAVAPAKARKRKRLAEANAASDAREDTLADAARARVVLDE